MDTESDICRHCECSGHVTESDCDECANTMVDARLDPAPINRTPVAIIPQAKLAALRAQLATAVAALEAIKATRVYSMSMAGSEAAAWKLTCQEMCAIACGTLDELKGGDDGND